MRHYNDLHLLCQTIFGLFSPCDDAANLSPRNVMDEVYMGAVGIRARVRPLTRHQCVHCIRAYQFHLAVTLHQHETFVQFHLHEG